MVLSSPSRGISFPLQKRTGWCSVPPAEPPLSLCRREQGGVQFPLQSHLFPSAEENRVVFSSPSRATSFPLQKRTGWCSVPPAEPPLSLCRREQGGVQFPLQSHLFPSAEENRVVVSSPCRATSFPLKKRTRWCSVSSLTSSLSIEMEISASIITLCVR